jgi:hypothetical protein
MNSRRLLPAAANVAKGLVFMKIIATFPASGFRLSLERSLTNDAEALASTDASASNSAPSPASGPAAYSYRGDLHFADRVEPASCTVFADGSVRVEVAPEELHEKVRLLVRAAIKGPLREGLAPPRRIQRWRDGA